MRSPSIESIWRNWSAVRTAELETVNAQMRDEIRERQQTEAAVLERSGPAL